MTTMMISKELLDELLSGVERPEDLLGDKGLMKELKVRLLERMLGAELTEHLGYEPHGEPASQQANRRNGSTRKVLKGNDGAVPIDVPRDRDRDRDRDGSFEPELIPKGQTRIDGMDDKIIGLYATGLSPSPAAGTPRSCSLQIAGKERVPDRRQKAQPATARSNPRHPPAGNNPRSLPVPTTGFAPPDAPKIHLLEAEGPRVSSALAISSCDFLMLKRTGE
jgi:hypothetical protein